jgi:hypothetical protein
MLKNKTLEQIKQLHETQMDEKVREKASLVKSSDSLKQSINNLMSQMHQEAEVAQNNTAVTFTFASYYQASKNQLATMTEELVKQEIAIDFLTQEILAIHTEMKKYEKLQELNDSKEIQREIKEEQKSLDEYNTVKQNSSN